MMAELYCDHGAYGAYATTPTWGQAQDGDGTAKTVGTPSTASVVFTGVPSSGAISVLGQSIIFTKITSADVCANNLAAGINGSVAVATGPASFTNLSQLRNHLYARGPANGAPAGTCQIMTRQASAAHAGMIAVTHTLNNVSSPATINFEGGSGGCWGHFNNIDATIWPSTVVAGTYGVWAATPPFAGAMLPGDVVNIRAGKTLVRPTNAALALLCPPGLGLPGSPVVFRVDDGTQWPADGPAPVFRINFYTTSNNTSTFGGHSSSVIRFLGKRYNSGAFNMQVYATSNGVPSVTAMRLALDGDTLIEGVELYSDTFVQVSRNSSAAAQFPDFWGVASNCMIRSDGRAPTIAGAAMVTQGLNTSYKLKYVGCEFNAVGAISPWTLGVVHGSSSGTGVQLFEACRFVGFLTGTRLNADVLNVSNARSVIFQDCDFGGITDRVPSALTAPVAADDFFSRFIQISSNFGKQEFALERMGLGYCEWNSSKSFPTLNAKLLDGITPWSIYGVLSPLIPVSQLFGLPIPALVKEIPPSSILAEGVRTLTVELLVESTLPWTKQNVSCTVTYQTPSGVTVREPLLDFAATPLTVSSATWTSTTYNGQSWLPRKTSFVTKQPVKEGSLVRVDLSLSGMSANTTLGIFIDPEVLVS